MKTLRHSFCDPFKPDVIELGDIESKEVISRFEQISWDEIIFNMGKANKSDIHYSPSLEFEDETTKHGIVVSGVGTSSLEEFYVSYKRPKRVKILFGLIERDNPEYYTDVTGQTKEDVIEILNAFITGKYDFLDSKIK
ncbi:hypothetical protein [Rufibacter hautae]|uniref:Uncharacterized protein n=1 Tax=Rufibacter hautae TaxID=2595005 RepID=A0A5B6TIT5_9BACT|nr:hypothetical protein [Rufibacter hautae]KAA3440193.1 hypothetical protein FOA19_05890 [Rufibacter hautae]